MPLFSSGLIMADDDDDDDDDLYQKLILGIKSLNFVKIILYT